MRDNVMCGSRGPAEASVTALEGEDNRKLRHEKTNSTRETQDSRVTRESPSAKRDRREV